LPEILIAKLTGIPVVAFVWDIYPASTVEAGNMRDSRVIWLYALTETIGLRAANVILVPSEDYIPHLERYKSKVKVHPLWLNGNSADFVGQKVAGQVKLVFAGQINAIRGIAQTLQAVRRLVPDEKIVLDIFSADKLTEDVLSQASRDSQLIIRHQGFLAREHLLPRLMEYDFGVVAINHRFSLPAFPSKILTYVASGLPFLYSGPHMSGVAELAATPCVGIVLEGRENRGQDLLSIRSEEFEAGRVNYYTKVAEAEGSLLGFLRTSMRQSEQRPSWWSIIQGKSALSGT